MDSQQIGLGSIGCQCSWGVGKQTTAAPVNGLLSSTGTTVRLYDADATTIYILISSYTYPCMIKAYKYFFFTCYNEIERKKSVLFPHFYFCWFKM